MNIEFKKDPWHLAFCAVLCLAVFGLVIHKDVTWAQAVAFLGAAIFVPGLFGKKQDDTQ